MIKLYLNSLKDGMQEVADPLFSGSLISIEPDQSHDVLHEPSLITAPWLNIFVADSRFEEIKKRMANNTCILNINILRYSDKDTIVPKSSVEAVGRLTKSQLCVLRELMTKDTIYEIANRLCRSYATIKRHIHDIYQTLNLNNRCHAVCAYLRYLQEFSGSQASGLTLHKSKNHERPKRKSYDKQFC